MIMITTLCWICTIVSGIWSHPGNQVLSVYDDLGPSLRRGHIGLQGPTPGRRVLRGWSCLQVSGD